MEGRPGRLGDVILTLREKECRRNSCGESVVGWLEGTRASGARKSADHGAAPPLAETEIVQIMNKCFIWQNQPSVSRGGAIRARCVRARVTL